jgi:hypothetical protein
MKYTKGHSGQYSNWIQKDPRVPTSGTRAQLNILYNIICRFSEKWGICYLTNESMGEMLGSSAREIQRMLVLMKELQYIIIDLEEKKDNDGKPIMGKHGGSMTVRKIYPVNLQKIEMIIKNLIEKPETIMEKKTKRTINRTQKKDDRCAANVMPPSPQTSPNKEDCIKEKDISKTANDNTFLNSLEENSKPKKEYPNSIRQKAIELDPNTIVNEEGQTTAPVFGKGFSKYSEDLYDL